MSCTVEIELASGDRDLEAVLEALGGLDAWALDLRSRGAASVVWMLSPAAWERALDPVLAALAAGGIEAARVEARPTVGSEWGASWQPRLLATRAGPLWIVSPGRKAPPGARHVLTVDATYAFGAGTHETTMLCLERIIERSPVTSVLDVGTGSGILALAALELGALHAVGTDIDPRALDAARANAALNRAGARLELRTGPPDATPANRAQAAEFPLVLANVRTPALIEMARALARCVAPGGDLVLSGVRSEEREPLLHALAALPALTLERIAERGDWLRLDLTRA